MLNHIQMNQSNYSGTDKIKYYNYKNNGFNQFNEDESLGIKILEILEKANFSPELEGTYLYKDVIRNIIKCLSQDMKESEIVELRNQLNNPYSQFYFDISKNDRGKGLKTFHSIIREVIKGSNYKITDLGEKDGKDYGEFAYEIARYMIDNNICFEKKSPTENKGQIRLLIKEKMEA